VLITLSTDQRKKTDDEFLTDVEAASDEVLAATAAVDAIVVAADEAVADVVVIKKGKIRKTRKKSILKN
jgi:hypothetical protein